MSSRSIRFLPLLVVLLLSAATTRPDGIVVPLLLGALGLQHKLAGRDPETPAVLLAHDPTTFRLARREAIDLQLSGHTHGGQIWPFEYLVRLAVPYIAGHYRRNGSQLYVSRGTGFWGPPMRLGPRRDHRERPAPRRAAPAAPAQRQPSVR